MSYQFNVVPDDLAEAAGILSDLGAGSAKAVDYAKRNLDLEGNAGVLTDGEVQPDVTQFGFGPVPATVDQLGGRGQKVTRVEPARARDVMHVANGDDGSDGFRPGSTGGE